MSNESKLQLDPTSGTLRHQYLEEYSTEGGRDEIYQGLRVYLVPRKTPLRAECRWRLGIVPVAPWDRLYTILLF
jgi:hypothetical protein